MRFLICAALAVSVAGCAAPTRYVKPVGSHHALAIDRLDCAKAAVVAHRNVLARSTALDNTARVRANAAARTAVDRCAISRGYRRVN